MTTKRYVVARVRVELDVSVSGFDAASSVEEIEKRALALVHEQIERLVDPGRTNSARGVQLAAPIAEVRVEIHAPPRKDTGR